MVSRFRFLLNEAVNILSLCTAVPGKMFRIEVGGSPSMSLVYLIILGLSALLSENTRHEMECGGIVYEKDDPERIFVKVKSAVYDDTVSQFMANSETLFSSSL